VNKQDIINASDEIRTLLNSSRNLDGKAAERLTELDKEYGHIPAIKKLYAEKYDAVAMHSGFGAPDCTCFSNPPCQACIDWTNYCAEREEAVEVHGEPGCVIIDHDCDVVRNPA
jgi:hypothetical protein